MPAITDSRGCRYKQMRLINLRPSQASAKERTFVSTIYILYLGYSHVITLIPGNSWPVLQCSIYLWIYTLQRRNPLILWSGLGGEMHPTALNYSLSEMCYADFSLFIWKMNWKKSIMRTETIVLNKVPFNYILTWCPFVRSQQAKDSSPPTDNMVSLRIRGKHQRIRLRIRLTLWAWPPVN